MGIKDKLKQLGFEVGRTFSFKKIEASIGVINETGEVFLVSDEYGKFVCQLDENYKITNHIVGVDILPLLINSARNEEERKLLREIALKIRVLDKHKNIAS